MHNSGHGKNQPKIIIIDDNPLDLKLLKAILSQHGYSVNTAQNAQEGLMQILRESPHLILLDIKLPGIDGYQLCSILKARAETKYIPVIFFSGITQNIEKIKAFSVGGIDFIGKPFQTIELLAKIQHQINYSILQKTVIETEKLLQAEINKRKQLEETLNTTKAQLTKEIEQRQYMEDLLRHRTIHLIQQVNIDALTQVANRRYFNGCFARELQWAIREGNPLSLVLCDVDYFKLYNDTYGHQAGDDCLYQVAQTLANVVNLPGDLVARYGGEEFVIILPDTFMGAAIAVIHSIRKAIANLKIQHQKSAVSQYITLSFGGVTLKPPEQLSSYELLKKADESLYQAKHNGRNQVYWHQAEALDNCAEAEVNDDW